MDFFFNVTNFDLPLADRLLTQIQTFFPDSNILCVTDGEVIGVDHLLSVAPKLILIKGERLKKPNLVGEFTTRNFYAILRNLPAQQIIKLDPDTYIRRPFAYVPEGDWCGEVKSGIFQIGSCWWARGGCFLIRREAIQIIVESQLLLHPRYKYLEDFETREHKLYESFRLGHVANSLGIYPTKWPEISCEKLGRRDRRSWNKAVVHPVK